MLRIEYDGKTRLHKDLKQLDLFEHLQIFGTGKPDIFPITSYVHLNDFILQVWLSDPEGGE